MRCLCLGRTCWVSCGDKIFGLEELYVLLPIFIVLRLVNYCPVWSCEKSFCKDTGCLMIYWLRLTLAFRFEAGIETELSTENPECCQESIFNAKQRSAEWRSNSPLSTNSFITRLLKTSVSFAVSFIGMWWKNPVSLIPSSKTIQWKWGLGFYHVWNKLEAASGWWIQTAGVEGSGARFLRDVPGKEGVFSYYNWGRDISFYKLSSRKRQKGWSIRICNQNSYTWSALCLLNRLHTR